MLEQWYIPQTTGVPWDSFKGLWSQNCCRNSTKTFALLTLVNIYASGAKTMEGETADALIGIKAMAPNCTSSFCIDDHQALTVEKFHFHLRISLNK